MLLPRKVIRSTFTFYFIALLMLFSSQQIAQALVTDRGGFLTFVNIEVPNFHNVTPRIALVYDSDQRNGELGMGWVLSAGSRISRTSAWTGAPRYDSSDVLWLDGLRLIPCASARMSASCRSGGTHATEVESYQRIIQDTNQNTWTVWSTDGTRSEYRPHLGDVSSAAGTLRWALTKAIDTHDNAVFYNYSCVGSQNCLLSSIEYGNGNTCKADDDVPVGSLLPGVIVRFIWEPRPDSQTIAQGGFFEKTDQRLRAIDISDAGSRVRAYQLTYAPELSGPGGYKLERSWLASVQQFGSDAQLDASGTIVSGTALPAVSFEAPAQYRAPDPARADTLPGINQLSIPEPMQPELPPIYDGTTVQTLPPTIVMRPHSSLGYVAQITSEANVTQGDFDGDHKLDFLIWSLDGSCTNLTTRTVLGGGSGFVTDDKAWTNQSACGSQATMVYPADVDGDGRSDLLLLQYRKLDPYNRRDMRFQADAIAALSNGDGTFTLASPVKLWESATQQEVFAHQCSVGDLNGDARADIACMPFTSGLFGPVLGFSDGLGQFQVQAPTSLVPVDARLAFDVAEINADGLFDLVIVDKNISPGAQDTLVFKTGINRGDGTFSWHTQHTSHLAPFSGEQSELLSGDINGDNRTDFILAAGDNKNGSFATFLSSGGASRTYLSRRSTITGKMPTPSIGDYDGNGHDELILAFDNSSCSPTTTYPNAGLYIAWSYSTGWPGIPQSAGCYSETNLFYDSGDWASPWNPRAANVNGDGNADLFSYYLALVNTGTAMGATVLKEEFFLRDHIAPQRNMDISDWRPTDVNGDGGVDWIRIADANPGLVAHTRIMRQNGGYLSVPVYVPASTGASPDLSNDISSNTFVVDVGGGPSGSPDGRADLVVIDDSEERITTLLGNGDGTWRKIPSQGPFTTATAIRGHGLAGRGDRHNWRAMDVDGDGRSDLVHTRIFQSNQALGGPGKLLVKTLFAQGDGTWESIATEHFSGFYDDADARGFISLDIDGDGRTDLAKIQNVAGRTSAAPTGAVPIVPTNTVVWSLLSRGRGLWSENAQRLAERLPAPTRWWPMEVNGDGRADLASVSSTQSGIISFTAMLSLGDATWASPQTVPITSAPAFTANSIGKLQVNDLDGDGRQELLFLGNTHWDPTVPRAGVMAIWNRFPEMVQTTTTGLPVSATDLFAWKFADLNADGVGEFVHIQPSQPFLVDSITVPALQVRMTRMANGMGASEEVTYGTEPGRSATMPLGSVVQTVDTVAARSTPGSLSVDALSSYNFSGATYSFERHRFLGFQSMEVDDGKRIVATAFDLHDRCGARRAEVDLLDSQRRLLARTHTGFAPTGTPPVAQCHADSIRHEEWEGTQMARVSEQHFGFDAYGNPIRSEETGDPATGEDDRLFEIEYFPNAIGLDYIVNRPASTKIYGRGTSGSWNLVAATYSEYDGSNDFRLKPNSLGELTRERRWKDIGGFAERTFEYDNRGDTIKITGPAIPSNPNGVEIATTYDCEFQRFPEKVCTGHLCSTAQWDKTKGVVVSLTEPNGGVTSLQYDVLGRLEQLTHPDGSFARTRWPSSQEWDTPGQAETREVSDGSSDGVLTEERFFDGLGRTTSLLRERGIIDATFSYDGISDRVDRVTAPHFISQPGPVTTYDYDAAGRQVRVTNPDNTSRAVRYLVGSITVTDEIGATIDYRIDPFGRITSVNETQRACVAENCPVTQSAETNYSYDVLDNLVSIRDAFANYTEFDWSSLDLLESICDPDRGCTLSSWNDDGTLASMKDANGSVRQIAYDAIARPTTYLSYDASGRLSHKATWEWDYTVRPAPGIPGVLSGASLGRVTRLQEDASGVGLDASFHYDSLGRIDELEKCISASCVELAAQYDLAGRTRTITYPDYSGRITANSETITYNYDDTGFLVSADPYLRKVLHDAAGNTTHLEFNNGVTETRSFDPKRGLADGVSVEVVSRAGPRTVAFEQTMVRDKIGLVEQESISAAIGPSGVPAIVRTDTYEHDDLRRLVEVTSTDPLRSEQISYDAIGNVTSRNGIGAPPLSVGRIYYNDSAHVHAITDTDNGRHYEYDAAGRMVLTDDLELEWSPEHRLTRVTDRATQRYSTYTYDWTGRRVRIETGAGVTLEPDSLVEIDQNGRIHTWFNAEGRRLARDIVAAPSRGASAEFFHADALGSTRLVTNAKGVVVEANDYGVWGETVGTWSSSSLGNRFIGGRFDPESGFTLLGSRLYDAELGRFISADPIIPNPYDPQMLNRYAYAANDPITLSDPTGYAPQGGWKLVDDPDDPSGVKVQFQGTGSDISEWEQWPRDHFFPEQSIFGDRGPTPPPMVEAQVISAIPPERGIVPLNATPCTACDAMAQVAQTVANQALAANPRNPRAALRQFDAAFSTLYNSGPFTSTGSGIKMWLSGGNPRSIRWVPAYWGQTGFRTGFRDSGADTVGKSPTQVDQTHHFSMYLSGGINGGNGVGALMSAHIFRDNAGDAALGRAARDLGATLAADPTKLGTVGKLILCTICGR